MMNDDNNKIGTKSMKKNSKILFTKKEKSVTGTYGARYDDNRLENEWFINDH